MFVGVKHKPHSPEKYRRARELRRFGSSIKVIATELSLSPATVHRWTTDIELSAEQRRTIDERHAADRGRRWSETCRQRRLVQQLDGRERAHLQDPMHTAGCMLYWAEGTKNRNSLRFANSDPGMLVFFKSFLDSCFELDTADFSISVNVHLGNGLSIREIEHYWLEALDLPESCLRKAVVDKLPSSSKGSKRHHLSYGVCTLRVRRSTAIVQHIYGAIQEYARFEQPAWLD